MKYIAIAIVIAAFVLTGLMIAPQTFAQKSSSDILKEGLLGAGAGAVGASVGKGKGGVWKGALAGAGVTVVGGALLDSMSGEHVATTKEVDTMSNSQDAFNTGYKEGYNNGYKTGYTEGYKETTLDFVAAYRL